MPTRFYLTSNTATPPNSPGFAAWSRTTEGVRRKMSPTKDASASAVKAIWANGTAAINESALAVQFHSAELSTGIAFATTDTIKCYIRCQESAANDNINRQPICVKVYNGTTLQATLKALGHIGPNTTEWVANVTPGASMRNKTLADGDVLDANYTTVAGDYLVIEVGGQVSSAGGTSVTGWLSFGSDNAADLGENETDTTALNPWFEISRTLTFLQTGTATDTLPNLAAAVTAKQTQSGTSAVTLKKLTASATGAQTQSGTAADTLPSLVAGATGLQTQSGTSVTTLPNLAASATGSASQAVSGVAAAALPNLTAAASGLQTQTGTIVSGLPSLTASATGIQRQSGAGTSTLPSVVGSSTGLQTQSGSLISTLPSVAASADGSTGSTGQAALTLANLVVSAAGSQVQSGAAVSTLPKLNTIATGEIVGTGITGTLVTFLPRLVAIGYSEGIYLDAVATNSTQIDAVATANS